MKRSAEEAENGTADGQPSSESKKKAKTDDYDEEDDDLPSYAPSKLSSQKREGKECPYLDTVSRQVQLRTLSSRLDTHALVTLFCAAMKSVSALSGPHAC